MRIKSTVVLFLTLALLFGCDNESDSSNNVTNEFIGSWYLDCDDGISGTYTFTSESYIADFSEYENADCSGSILSSELLESAVVYGDKIAVESGVEATELDIYFDIDGEDIVLLSLIYRDGDLLYWGMETEDESRSTDINFDVFLVLQ